ncbi:CHAT domain-containing protein [Lacinutrix neustonica]|uniref:CHAT domain-containing protein n=1 Tax=Lacinutrix neustonica TaxID=2980107 RepID=A0A9E8MYC7_9FLAO|nr:CHAT domain-containing protein [Lacinutrix neustonica]WAC03626.1 CHAT domain-containing protein [Lacinutrix neustonica]
MFYKNELNYDFKKSQEYFTKFLKKATADKNSEMIFKASNNLAVLYNIEKKDSALYYITNGIKYAKEDLTLARLYVNKAEYYFNKNDTGNAIKTLQSALQLTLPTKTDSAITFSPSFKTLTASKHPSLSTLALKNKAKYILEDNELSKNQELLQLAYQSISLADRMIDFIRIESLENDSKLLRQEAASNIYMLGVKACYKLNKPNEAFYFIEKNRALLLLENIKNKTNSSLPAAILQQEQEYKKRIYALENQLNLTESSALKNEYHSLKIDYNNFIKSLEVSYPAYYNAKQNIHVENIASIKEVLDDHTTILEYIINKEHGFLLIITKDNTRLLDLGDTKNLETKINEYLKRIRHPLKTSEELENYNKTAHYLYNTLLPIKDPTILKNKLVIIPDYTLQNLPFESLKNNDKYLIEDFEISYAYSLTFLNSNKSIKREAPQSFIGFAPSHLITIIYKPCLAVRLKLLL